ncbi:chemotaxis protein methyltransferase CheR [Aureibacillus halotolerans]|uniref:Chemotaxis protein methyltransferase CheR n=2 Tax=Aureibacillus halotolerans TaxID=1508390 RepID=A0A4R6U5N1_9BACI|nr:protein-glutamate O-methyltransferase CheR [Aureibacillus halotolerans]TDQ41531.1 chemotaxis protein methyltransferase CheR [Aureibacillus halotolerans]
MDDYQQFVQRYKERTGLDLTLYKEKQMKRRLITLRDKLGFENFHDVITAISSDASLEEMLSDKVTINVSEFYRNSDRWKELEERLLPQMMSERKRPIRIWSAACSTGEEPYTLAMISERIRCKVQILATDIDQKVLNKAREATYKAHAIKQVPPDVLTLFFESNDNEWRVQTKKLPPVTFDVHDLLRNDYPQGQDLIVCRNVCIYFTEEAKALVYKKFADALTSGGLLFVGSTEQIFRPERYGLRHESSFFYRKL